MHITGREFSRTYALGDANYITASDDEKSDIIDYYADALNVLDSDNTYQLTVINQMCIRDRNYQDGLNGLINPSLKRGPLQPQHKKTPTAIGVS